MKKQLSTALACGMMAFGMAGMVGMADATLISKDLNTVGDQSITYDSITGLEWLDVILTNGISYNNVLAGYGGYTTTNHFRYATDTEVRTLFQNYGFSTVDYWSGAGTTGNWAPAQAIFTDMGITSPGAGSTMIWGYRDGMGLTSTNVWASAVDASNDSRQLATAVINWNTYSRDSAMSGFGSFLVRDATSVPEPATMLLLGTGLAGIGFMRRRRNTAR